MPAFVTYVHLRWGDLDAYGHCNNAAFITYLEQARVDVFHSVDALELGVTMLGDGVVVVDHKIRYRRQVAYSPTPLRVVLWTAEVKSASYTTKYEIWNDSGPEPELSATAESILAPINFDTGRPRRMTEKERTFLRSYMLEPDETQPGEVRTVEVQVADSRAGGAAHAVADPAATGSHR